MERRYERFAIFYACFPAAKLAKKSLTFRIKKVEFTNPSSMMSQKSGRVGREVAARWQRWQK